MKRRDFIRTGAGSAISLSAFPYHLFAATTKKNANDRVKLGPMKVEMSRLAMGTGTNGSGGSSNQTKKIRCRDFAARPAITMRRMRMDLPSSARRFGAHADHWGSPTTS